MKSTVIARCCAFNNSEAIRHSTWWNDGSIPRSLRALRKSAGAKYAECAARDDDKHYTAFTKK